MKLQFGKKPVSKASDKLGRDRQENKIYYSCVVDASTVFYWQTWNLVNSLIKLAQVSPAQIFVHYTPEVDPLFIRELNKIEVNLKPIKRFGDGKYCNKIAQLSTKEFATATGVFLLDTDMVALEELAELYTPNTICGKIVDLANPQLSVLKNIFRQAGFKKFPALRRVDYQFKNTFKNNFNGGLYVVPGTLIDTLRERWMHWALWLLDNLDLLIKVNKQAHVDQISFAMATHELSVKTKNVGRKYNYPIHLPQAKKGYPKLIHYHRNISPTGNLEVNGRMDRKFQSAVKDANKLFGDRFNNQIFWSCRYQLFPELGSGVGSRGKNLAYKQQLLKTYGVETCKSILDIGCGDLEVVKELNIVNYTGIDVSPQAIKIARQKRPDWNFFLLDGDRHAQIPQADMVICFEVLIHQPDFSSYQQLIDFLVAQTHHKLIVSGYTKAQPHHQSNHMVNFHESLIDSLERKQLFSHIEVIGEHSDVRVVLAVK